MAAQETITITQWNFDPDHLANMMAGLSVGMIALALLFVFALFLIKVFFSLSCYRTMKKVPCHQRVAPAWLCWLFLIPLIGYIFEWIMLPFIIPNSIQQYKADNPTVVSKAKSLFGIGLAYLIISIALAIPVVNFFGFIAVFILWIIYWVKVVSIRELL